MKTHKIESFIYLCFFIAASALYQSFELQRELENKMDNTEMVNNQLEDAVKDI